jgi:hypothetical protein
MSEEPKAETPAPDPKAPKPKKEGRWRRRIIVSLIVLVGLLLILRVALSFILPVVINKVAEAFDLKATFGSLDVTLLGGNAQIWNFQLLPKDGNDPILQADYCEGNISILDLLRGRLVVYRAAADGVSATIERTADGKIPLLERFVKLSTASKPAPTTSTPAPLADISLAPPLRIDALRLEHIRARVDDQFVQPPLDARIALDLRISDLGVPGKPLNFELVFDSDPVLESLDVYGTSTGDEKSQTAKFNATLRGLHLKPAEGYLRQIGLKPVADSIYASMAGTLRASVPQSDPKSVAADLELTNSSITVDGKPAAALDLFSLQAEALNTRSAHLRNVLIQGVKCQTLRAEDGSLQGFGVALAPALPAPPPRTPPAPTTAPSPTLASAPAAPTTNPDFFPFHFKVDQFAIRGFHAGFTDLAISPPVNLALDLPELELTNLAYDPGQGPVPMNLAATLSSPGMAKTISVQGVVTPNNSGAAFNLQAKAEGIAPTAIKPYLDALGLASDWDNGAFTATVDGSVTDTNAGLSASAKVTDINLTNGSPLLAFTQISATNAGFDPTAQKLHVDEILVEGPELSASRDAAGHFHILGFHTQPPINTAVPAPEISSDPDLQPAPTNPTTAPSPETAAKPSAPLTLPAIEIGHFAWRNVHLDVKDEGVSPPSTISIADAGIDLKNLLFDIRPDAPTRSGTLHAWLESPELARKVSVDGTLSSAPQTAALAFDVTGEGISGASIAAYLTPLGIKPTIQNGSIALHSEVGLSQTQTGFAASLSCENLNYQDGDQPLFALKSAKISDVAIAPKNLTFDKIAIDSPELWLNRQADGSFSLLGIDVTKPPQPTASAPTAAAVATPTATTVTPAVAGAAPAQPTLTDISANTPSAPLSPSTSFGTMGQGEGSSLDQQTRATPTSTLEPTTEPSATPPAPPSLPIAIALNSFTLHAAQLHWKDAAVKGTESSDASLDASLNKLIIAEGASPADIHFDATIDQSLDSVTGDGTLAIAPTRQEFEMAFKGAGLRAGPLAAYLPPGATVQLQNGQFAAALKASAAFNPKGGEAAQFAISNIDYRDANQPDPLLKLDSFYILAPRIDPSSKIVNIDDIWLSGFETQAHKTKAGVSLLGLEITPPPPTAPTTPPPPEPPAPSSTPVAPASAQPSVNALDLIRAERGKYPLVTLKNLDLNLSQIALADDTTPARSPVMIRSVRLHNTAPIAWLGRDPEANPPTQLQLAGRVDPLFDKFNVDIQAVPFSKQKTLNTKLLVDQIHGNGLVAVVPEIKTYVDGFGLKAGRFESESEISAKLNNVSPADFGLAYGGKINFSVKNAAFRVDPSQDPVAGVGEIDSEGIVVGPNFKNVEVKELEIDDLLARAMRDNAGIHALGLLIKIPALATTQPVMASAANDPAPTAKPSTPTPPPAPPAPSAPTQLAAAASKPTNLYKIDSLIISGCDVQIEDRTAAPPLIMPINSLDVTVKNISNMLPYDPEPCQFNVLVNAGKSPMLAAHSADISKLEERELFSQASAVGKVALYPKLTGWTKLSVSGFELASLHGLASQHNVTLNGGTFDSDIDLRYPGDGSIDTSNKLVVTDLAVTEPDNGPISKILKLPAPLDVVLGVVQDADGSITMPINFSVQNEHIDETEIATSAVGAVGSIVTNAIAAAPLKLLGLGGKPTTVQPVTLVFPPGYASVSLDQASDLQGLIKKLTDDDSLVATLRHDVGSEDISLAGDRVNPTPQDALLLAARLQQRKGELLTARAQAAGDLRSLLASDASDEAAGAITRLQRIDRALAETENAMDKAYDLLRPGADRQKDRRTRAAVLSVARARLDAVRDAIISADEKHLSDRVTATNPQLTPTSGAVESSVTITVVKKK